MGRRHHHMRFGSEIQPDGRVRFGLWAPGARRVELCLEGREPAGLLPLAAEDDGWFGLVTEIASVNSLYRYRIDEGDLLVPDPATRFQPGDVHGPSQVIDARHFQWHDDDWRGRPWEEAVIYEMHIGTFTAEGTFAAAVEKLDALVQLGVTAVELMPVAEFPGRHDWGYNGVMPFAPDSRYGAPDDLKRFIQAAHARGLMVFLDVVYNHFGPEGNYLHTYAPQFFTHKHHTPWGDAINFDDTGNTHVRHFFIHNALYWLEEYHFDGLRLDAVHAIKDDSRPDILEELADRIQRSPEYNRRHIHLVLENDDNRAQYLDRDDGKPRWYVAQWNDDIHHALHVLTTGDTGGYYRDYAEEPVRLLGRSLTEGFAYQGEASSFRQGQPRGEPSADLPPTAFVSFLQNHDQIGNRAFGERITQLATHEAVRAATAVLLLAPSPPLLFMGQEWAASQPFLFFCDFSPDLRESVTEGRRREFARFPDFSTHEARERIPDPTIRETFERSILDWSERDQEPHRDWLAFHRHLLAMRHQAIVPRIPRIVPGRAGYEMLGRRCIQTWWPLHNGMRLTLVANMSEQGLEDLSLPLGTPIYESHPDLMEQITAGRMPPWSVAWLLEPSG